MKKLLFLIILAVFFVEAVNVQATHYLVENGDNFGNLTLDGDTLLMTGGTGENLVLFDSSTATIENTSPLGSTPGDGGIWSINLNSYSTLNLSGGGIENIQAINESIINMTGGSVNSLEMYHESMSYLYGGDIGTLASAQPLILIPPEDPGPHGWIQFFCREYDYNSDTNLLTGLWADSSAFSINLLDIGTYPTYDQIEFHIIPEPATIILLGLGGLWLRKKRSL